MLREKWFWEVKQRTQLINTCFEIKQDEKSDTISLVPLRVISRHTNSIIAHANVPFLILNLEKK